MPILPTSVSHWTVIPCMTHIFSISWPKSPFYFLCFIQDFFISPPPLVRLTQFLFSPKQSFRKFHGSLSLHISPTRQAVNVINWASCDFSTLKICCAPSSILGHTWYLNLQSVWNLRMALSLCTVSGWWNSDISMSETASGTFTAHNRNMAAAGREYLITCAPQ